MSYATLADLTVYLGIDDSVADDALLTAFLARAQAAIDSATRRTFEAVTATRYYDAASIDGDMLYVDADLCVITSVTNGNGQAVASTQYVTLPRNVKPWYALRLKATATVQWDGTTGDIAVAGKWGYSETAPADIAQATVRLAAWMYRQKDNAAADTAMVAGDVTILPARMPSDVGELIAPYRRVSL